jgi:hypothetical protein
VENRHGGKNVHDVPEDKLEIMRNRFEFKLWFTFRKRYLLLKSYE